VDDTLLDLAEAIACRRNEPPLTQELIRRFGGRGFIFNVRMWEAITRNGPVCLYAPGDLDRRGRLETLAGTGIAVRGRDIPLEMRLLALPLPVLRQRRAASPGSGLTAPHQLDRGVARPATATLLT